MPSLPKLRTLWRLSFTILRESYYQMNRYQYEARGRKISKWNILAGVVMTNLIINILGLGFSIGIFIFPSAVFSGYSGVDPVGISIFSFSSLIMLLSSFTIFTSSWMVQVYGTIDPIMSMPLSRKDISLSYLFSISYSILWVFIATPISLIILYMRGYSPQYLLAAVYAPLLSLAIGVSIGTLLSTLIGGRRYSGPSKRASIIQLLNIIIYGFIFIILYQFYTISKVLIDFVSTVALIGFPKLVSIIIFPLNLLYVGNDWMSTLIPLLIWAPALYKVSSFSRDRFIRGIMHPVYITIGASHRVQLKYNVRGGYLLGLSVKDLKMLFRDIRITPLLIMPFIVMISFLIGPIQVSGSGIDPVPLFIIPSFATMTFLIPVSISNLTRVDAGRTWILFSHGLDKRHYYKAKMLTSSLLTIIYMIGLITFATLYLSYYYDVGLTIRYIPEIVVGIVFVSAASILTSSIHHAHIIRKMTYDGGGLEPTLGNTMIALLLSGLNAIVYAVLHFMLRGSLLTYLFSVVFYIAILSLPTILISNRWLSNY